MELSVSQPFHLGNIPSVIADKLHRSDWMYWADDQQQAISDFFRTAFEFALTEHPHGGLAGQTADDWLCGSVLLGESAPETVERFWTVQSPNAVLNLAAMIVDESKNLERHGQIKGAFWEEVDETVRLEISNLLISKRSEERIIAACSEVSEEDVFQFLDPALTVIEQVS